MNTAVRRLAPSMALLAFAAVSSPASMADEIDDLVREEMARQRIPGVALAIVPESGVPRIATYGESNVEHHVPVRPDTVFQSGSIGKQFTAAAVQLLAAEGKLRLDDPVSRWLAPVPPAWESITLRQLLTHTSGMGDYGEETVDLRRDYTEEEFLEVARGVPLGSVPGTRWAYSNIGYMLLGIVIRRASGEFYGDILRERVFLPLGMVTARVISEADIVSNRAAGYRIDDSGTLLNQNWVSPSLNRTADGALHVTILDMVKWDAGLRAASVLSREQIAEAETPARLAGGGSRPYGFGWFLGDQRGERLVEHPGSWQGFEAHIARYTGRGLTIIALANLAGADPVRITSEVAGIVDAALRLPDAARAAPDPDPARTRRILEALIAWTEARPGEAMSPGFAALRDDSPRAAYFRGVFRERVSGRKSFHYLDEVDVSSRGIERNGSAVVRIAYFGVVGPAGADRVAAYLDDGGRVVNLTYRGY